MHLQALAFLRFKYAYDYTVPKVSSKFPGEKHLKAIQDTEASHTLEKHEQVSHKITLTRLAATIRAREVLSWKLF